MFFANVNWMIHICEKIIFYAIMSFNIMVLNVLRSLELWKFHDLSITHILRLYVKSIFGGFSKYKTTILTDLEGLNCDFSRMFPLFEG